MGYYHDNKKANERIDELAAMLIVQTSRVEEAKKERDRLETQSDDDAKKYCDLSVLISEVRSENALLTKDRDLWKRLAGEVKDLEANYIKSEEKNVLLTAQFAELEARNANLLLQAELALRAKDAVVEAAIDHIELRHECDGTKLSVAVREYQRAAAILSSSLPLSSQSPATMASEIYREDTQHEDDSPAVTKDIIRLTVERPTGEIGAWDPDGDWHPNARIV